MVLSSRIVLVLSQTRGGDVAFVVGGLGCVRSHGADVNFSINASQGVHSISPYIYGANQFNTSTPPVNLGLQRLGGNRWTGYNWETNYSNAGVDYFHNSDLYLTNGQVRPAGGAVLPALQAAATQGNALSNHGADRRLCCR